jgi:hypothetical protein
MSAPDRKSDIKPGAPFLAFPARSGTGGMRHHAPGIHTQRVTSDLAAKTE